MDPMQSDNTQVSQRGAPPVMIRDPSAISAESQPIEVLFMVSTTLKANPRQSSNRALPFNPERVGNCGGILDDGGLHSSHNCLLLDASVQGTPTHRLTSETIISRVKRVVESGDEKTLANYLRGEVAQTFIDVVHEALDLANLPPPLRRVCLSAFCRICGHQGLLPESLQLPLCYYQ